MTASPTQVRRLSEELQKRKLIDLEVSARELLSIDTVTDLVDPSVAADWYVVGGSHYVLVCGETAARAEEVSA